MKKLLIVTHAPSANTLRLREAVIQGAQHPDISEVEISAIAPLEANAEDVLACDAIILGTTENLGYMSGALKDFFDRVYYPCLEIKQGLPFALYVRAGHDGTGTCRAVDTITTGLRWKAVREHLVCRGEWQEDFVAQCQELGTTMAMSLEAGII
ncbi:flavodoxin family protein [Ketobacter sp.]|uniref:flavodoxin family protein n=1 Tax=Ketobacter sp. TaxID=2083498 RepID=UPI000F0F7459|nr:NAD(P)H-dependent oxidoreductase [Ketobacter sp.]RLT96326.1 MAG: flavodoxin family protein [Ketobacter sp.]